MVSPGTILEGKYEILDKIREGGMGSIYRVRHRLLEEIRVVKVMKPSVVADEDLRRRFVEEARTATRLKHPNICTIHDFAIDESGMAYLVMEFIDGVSVSELLKVHGPPSLPLTLDIAHQSLLALGFLHRKGIIHRDVAPDNIMLTRDDQGNPVVKLIDLGIAKVAEGPVEAATATGVFLGKLKYASPEQYGSLPRGDRIDGRSDLYGMGIVLYELLTGVLPFEGDTVVELLRAHVFSPPRPFAQSDPEGRVPEELRESILRALEKRREDRFATAEDFDRQILDVRGRHTRPEDHEQTRTMLAKLRPSGEARIASPTPSAQDRMDLRFIAGSTPGASLRIGEDERTEVAPVPDRAVPVTDGSAPASHRSAPPIPPLPTSAPPRPSPPPPAPPVPAAAPRRAPAWSVFAAVAFVAIAAFVIVTLRAKPPARDRPAAGALPVAPAPPTAAPAPTLAPTSEPTAVPTEPAPTPEAPARLAPTKPAHRDVAARVAPRVERIEPAPPVPTRANPTPAAAAVLPEPPRLAPATASAEAVRPPTPGAHPAAATVTDADRIRETVRLYETAQNTLNPDMYLRVFPGVDRSRIEEAFHSFRSQSVEFEIRKIDVDPRGATAEVTGFETRVAVPKAGNDLRVNAQRVLRLEKRGDAWVITAIQ